MRRLKNDLEVNVNWKTSQFNEYLGELRKDTWVVYNNFSGGMIEVKKDVYDALAENNLSGTLDPAQFKPLSYGKFIVESGVNEVDNLKLIKKKLNDEVKVVGLQVLPTLGCNFKCLYCYEQPENNFMKMSPEVMDAVVKHAKGKIKPTTELFNVMFFGGEPLLGIDCIRQLSKSFIQLAEEQKVRYYAFIVTNGYLLTPKNTDILEACQIRSCQVTLDGPAHVHDQRRMLLNGGKTWQRIVDNLKYVISNTNIKLTVRINIDSSNIGSVKELFKALEENGVFNKLSFSFGIVTNSGNMCKSVEDTLLTVEKADDMLKQLDLDSLLKNSANVIQRTVPDLVGCVAKAKHGLIIGPQGELYKCSSTVGDPNQCAGSIFNIDEENPNMKKWYSVDNLDSPICRTCSMVPVCNGKRCPYHTLVNTKNIINECNKEETRNLYLQKLKAIYLSKFSVSKNKI